MPESSQLILVLGGARSGKSTFAERLALERAAARAAGPGDASSSASVDPVARRTTRAAADAAGAPPPPSGAGRVTYLATAEAYDEEMRARIARHKTDRPEGWTTVECPLDVPQAVRAHAAQTHVFLLDCVTFWVSNLLFAAGGIGGRVPEGLGNFDKSFIPAEVERAAAAHVAQAVDDLIAALGETGAALIAVSNEVGLGLVPEYPLSRLYRDELGRANARLAAVADQVFFLVAGLPVDVKALSGPSPSPLSSL